MRRLAPLFLALLCAAVSSLPAPAATAPALPPLIKVETGAHQSFVNRILPLDGARLLTISDDQTARLWAASGRADTVVRGRAGLRDEGALYAVAASTKYIALGGRSGMDQGSSFVRLLDRKTLKPAGLLAGLPDVVTALAFSADGQKLAVGFDRVGVKIYQIGQGAAVASIPSPGGAVTEVLFARDGRVVVVADGGIDILAADLSSGRTPTLGDDFKPWRAALSPDDRVLVVGSRSRANVALVDLATGAVRHSELPGEASAAPSVAWTSGGRGILVGGYAEAGGMLWKLAPDGRPLEAQPVDGAVTAVADGPDGALFADADGGWGRWRGGRLPDYSSRPAKLAFRSARTPPLSVSPDGLRLTFAANGRQVATLDLTARRADASAGPAVAAAPALDGPQPQDLDRAERVLSSTAIAGDPGRVVGTNFYVRRLDKRGRTLWKAPAAAAAWGVAVAAEARLVVVAQGDGTVAWLDLERGDLQLAAFVSPQLEWVAWTPDGFFDRSRDGGRLVGHVIDRGPREGSDFIELERTSRGYFRSDLVQAALRRGRGDREMLASARGSLGAASERLVVAAPPRVRIATVCGWDEAAEKPTACFEAANVADGVAWARLVSRGNKLDITIALDARGAAAGDTQLRVGKVRRTPIGERRIVAGGIEQRRFMIEVPEGDPIVEVSVASTDGAAVSEPALLRLKGVPAAAQRSPALYVLAIGVADYQLSFFDLGGGVASNDAKDFATTLSSGGNQAFAGGKTTVLTDRAATAPAIRAAFSDLIARVEPNDVVVVFFSGHGQQIDGDYVFAPYETGFADHRAILERAKRGEAFPDHLVSEIFRKDGISQAELSTALAALRASRILVILDTCFGGAFDALSGQQRNGLTTALGERFAESSGRYLIASARGFALDDPEAQDTSHTSIFTGSILRSLRGAADRDKDGAVTLAEVAEYVRADVPQRTAAQGFEQKPVISFFGDPYFPLVKAEAPK